MELPYHLRTLEPLTGALDIMRALRQEPDMLAAVDTLLDQLELSERAFGKAIRRLVTQGSHAVRRSDHRADRAGRAGDASR
jgi:hypothetical protein